MRIPTFFRSSGRLALTACLLGSGLALTNCAGVNRQVEEAKNFKDCTFALQSVEQATLGGVDVTALRSAADLTLADRARILAAYATGALPLRMRVNLQVTNPNNEVAALNALDYKVLLDGKELATGAITERLEVPANSTATVTVPVSAEAHQLVRDGGAEALGGFALGLADRDRQPSRITIAVRPSVKFLGATFKKSDYVTVDKYITARQLLNNSAPQRDSLGAARP